MRPHLLIAWLVLTSMSVHLLAAQDSIRVEGILVDKTDNEPLPFATVHVLKTNTGVETNYDGYFTIVVAKRATLKFSYIGYESLSFKATTLAANSTIGLTPATMTIPGPIVYRARLDYDDQNSGTSQSLSYLQLSVADNINIAQAFDGLPGVQVQQGALNTQRLSLRGIGARTPFATDQVRLYWNDIPLTNGAGESVLEDIESGFLGSASVQTGPGAVQLGANLGGSIQLVSRERNLANWYTNAGVSLGGFGRNRQWVNVHNFKKRWQQDITLARSASNGYRDNNEYDRLSGTVLGRIGGNNQAETFYFGHWRSLQAEIPSSLDATDFAENPEAAAFTWATANARENQQTMLIGLQHSRSIRFKNNPKFRLKNRSSVFFGRQTNDEVRPFNVLAEESVQWGTRSVLLGRINDLRFQLGGELYLENHEQQTFETLDGGVMGALLGEQAEDRLQYFIFMDWNYNLINKWFFTTSLNVRRTQYQTEAGPANLPAITFEPIVLPNLQMAYRPTRHWKIHAQLNRGISQPDAGTSIDNLPFSLDPLRPSSGWNREVGIDFSSKDLRIKATLFQMDITDAIVQRQDAATSAPFYVNAGEARHQGIEFQLRKDWQLTSSNTLKITSNYTFADYRFLNYIEDSNDFTGNRIPGNPAHRWLMHFDVTIKQFSARLSTDMASEQWVDDANTTQAEGYQLLHAHLGYTFKKNQYPIKIYAGLRNILDTNYASMVQINARGFGSNLPRHFYPGQPRYWYFGMNVGR